MKTYSYAIEWPCGVAVCASTGRPMRNVLRFPSRSARDAFVAAGSDGRTQSGFREAVTRREVSPEIRRAERHAADQWPTQDPRESAWCPDDRDETGERETLIL